MTQIPSEFVRLCIHWHDGQDSIMYGVASSGRLPNRTLRPWNSDENRPMTNREWEQSLWNDLGVDIRYCLHAIRKCGGHEDREAFERFESFVESQVS